jgi:predicted nucleic acid-binding protein
MEAQEIPLSTTEVNVLELYRGAYLSRKTHQNLEEIKKLLECFQVLELEESVYEVFALLSANLLSKGKAIGAFDELIAAIILCHDEKIVTRDNHFKEVPGLEVIVY